MDEHTVEKNFDILNIFAFTFNVNEWLPKDENCIELKKLKGFLRTECSTSDISIICLQETCENFLLRSTAERNDMIETWKGIFKEILPNSYFNYSFIKRTLIIISTKVNIRKMFSIKFEYEEFDGSSIFSEKSSNLVELDFGKNKLCIIGCHLIGAEKNNEIRLNQFKKIFEKQLADYKTRFYKRHYSEFDMSNFNGFIILGDLNFRVLEEFYQEKGKKLICEDNFMKYAKRDEFFEYCNTNFFPVTEAKICYKPTYKYTKDHIDFDSKCAPSYTDRILSAGPLYLEKHGSLSELKVSDHRPVYSIFKYFLPKKDSTLYLHNSQLEYFNITRKNLSDFIKIKYWENQILTTWCTYKAIIEVYNPFPITSFFQITPIEIPDCVKIRVEEKLIFGLFAFERREIKCEIITIYLDAWNPLKVKKILSKTGVGLEVYSFQFQQTHYMYFPFCAKYLGAPLLDLIESRDDTQNYQWPYSEFSFAMRKLKTTSKFNKDLFVPRGEVFLSIENGKPFFEEDKITHFQVIYLIIFYLMLYPADIWLEECRTTLNGDDENNPSHTIQYNESSEFCRFLKEFLSFIDFYHKNVKIRAKAISNMLKYLKKF